MTFLRGLLIALLIVASPAWSQDETTVPLEPLDQFVVSPLVGTFSDEAEWDTFANRVETAIEAGLASNSVLAELRGELADWRDTFLERQSLNGPRIATVSSQIAALGDAPESGEEDTRVATRRSELTAQLNELSVPATLATEAHTQADGLIGEIDNLIRERQTQTFLTRTLSPLNPSGWATTWESVGDAALGVKAEVESEITNPSRQSELVSNLPAIFALLALALVFLFRGRAWYLIGANAIASRFRRGHAVAQFVLSLGQIIIPLVGVVALAKALEFTGMSGRRLGALIEVIPLYGFLAIVGHWLAGQLAPYNMDEDAHPLGMSPQVSSRTHTRLIILGYAMALFGLVSVFVSSNNFSTASEALVMFPFGFLLAWALYLFGKIIRKSAADMRDDASRQFRAGLRTTVGRGLMLAAVGGFVLACLGYANAFEDVIFPASLSVMVLAVLLLLQRLSVDAYALFSKGEGVASEALIPVLIGFILVLLSLPVFALIWGAQVTDMTELWTRFREGFSIGDTTISPSNFLLFAIVFVIGYTITRMVQGALRSTVLPRTKMDAGGQNAVVSGMGYVGIILAAVVAIATAGIDLSGLAIVAGALSVGIGFGLQNIVSNFVAGIILLIERPISQGDWIEVGGQMGYVRDISVRSTRIETFDRTDVIVPNADLVSNQVTNWTRGNNVGRVIVPVGVAYGTDTDMIAGILQEIAEAHPMVLLNPPPSVVFQEFGADSLNFEIRAILRDVNYVLSVKSEMNHAIAKRFVAEGIEIPFGQRDIWLRNPEALDFGAKRPARKPSKPKGDTKA
ncbi:Small-conductance mechanosensitive channel [Octadecabacter temperatus]|uniref:Putative MscS family protein.1 n=1 Tax=Octadecabacter temperatus TaxID=1458307 RepID=A0A0K0Y4U1_9RHOB|nr:DUF3772 domain-containing protein [Octadecabacter temperatus]AKS45852.1 putative MscS family protein.1 precursor [Octadecabacter temperatus]SIO02023.1 Small-conductance mechanosensitive channel [Octadecabacter temperatus]